MFLFLSRFIACLIVIRFVAGADASSVAQQASKYFCTMCTDVTSDVPGACPKCGMKLVPRGAAGATSRSYSMKKRIVFSKATVDGFDIAVTLTPLAKADSNATHRVVVRAAAHGSRAAVTDADCWFHITYPGGKNIMPHLAATGGAYEGLVALRETGTYAFMAHVNMDDANVTRVITVRLR